MYWIDRSGYSIWVRRADLTGSGVENVSYVTYGFAADGLDLDLTAGKVYWTEATSSGNDLVRRASLNGYYKQTLVSAPMGTPLGITLDVPAGKMYWSDATGGGSGRILRADLSGANREDLITGLDSVRYMTIAPLPEPAILSVLLIGGVSLLRRRRLRTCMKTITKRTA